MNAANAYSYLFKNKDMVMKSVLKGVPNAEKVYTDKTVGMDTVTKLYYWARLIDQDPSAPQYVEMMKTTGLTAKQMDNIVGSRSMLKQISVSAHYNLKELLGIKGREPLDPSMLFFRQWGSLGISSNPDYYINPLQTGFSTIKELAEDTIDYYPEVAAYSQFVLGKPFEPLETATVKALF